MTVDQRREVQHLAVASFKVNVLAKLSELKSMDVVMSVISGRETSSKRVHSSFNNDANEQKPVERYKYIDSTTQ